MAFDVDGKLQQFFLAKRFAGQSIGSHQPRNDGGGTAAHAPRWRYGQLHPRLQGDRLHAHFAPNPLGSAVNEVVGAAAQVGALFAFNNQLKAFSAPLQHLELELVVQIKRCPEAVESRAEIGGCRGDIHHHGGADLRFSHRCALGGSARY